MTDDIEIHGQNDPRFDAAREAFGSITGGALSPVPAAAGDWWRLHTTTWHPLGTGTDVPAPAYVLPFALAASLLLGHTGAVVSGLMLLAVPIAAWGAWRLLKVVGHLVPEDLRRTALPKATGRLEDLAVERSSVSVAATLTIPGLEGAPDALGLRLRLRGVLHGAPS